jgi:hypothetical protein
MATGTITIQGDNQNARIAEQTEVAGVNVTGTSGPEF